MLQGAAAQSSIFRNHGIIELLHRDGRDLVAGRFRRQHDFFAEHGPPGRNARGCLPHADEHDVVQLEDIGFSQSFRRDIPKSVKETFGVLRG